MRRPGAAPGALSAPVILPGLRPGLPFVLLVLFVLLGLLLGGCATPREWYVVMPSPDGHRGSIVVTRDGTETVLEGPYSATRSGTPGVFTADAREVEQTFGAALRATPPRAVSFTLYFVENLDEFTEASRAEFPAIAAEMTRRPAPQITIIGHADTTGSHAHNDALSLRRAERMRAELVKLGIDAERIAVEARGKREPLVPTPDNQAEPRNRRVEVEVR